MAKTYKIEELRVSLYRDNTSKIYEGTLDELRDMFSYTLEKGRSWQHERGNKKINLHPATIRSLVTNLNNAVSNSCRSYTDRFYTLIEG